MGILQQSNSLPPFLVEIKDGNGYENNLPVASNENLGGVQPVTKKKEMTQPVGVDELGELWTEPSGVYPKQADSRMTQSVGIDETGKLWTEPAGIYPVERKKEMTQSVGIDEAGKLWTKPSGISPKKASASMTQDVGVDSSGHLKTYPQKTFQTLTIQTSDETVRYNGTKDVSINVPTTKHTVIMSSNAQSQSGDASFLYEALGILDFSNVTKGTTFIRKNTSNNTIAFCVADSKESYYQQSSFVVTPGQVYNVFLNERCRYTIDEFDYKPKTVKPSSEETTSEEPPKFETTIIGTEGNTANAVNFDEAMDSVWINKENWVRNYYKSTSPIFIPSKPYIVIRVVGPSDVGLVKNSFFFQKAKDTEDFYYDIPENNGIFNAILNANSLVNCRIIPTAALPLAEQDGYKGDLDDMATYSPEYLWSHEEKKGETTTTINQHQNSFMGIPYSSTRYKQLFVPNNVSMYTYLTAVDNPYSIVYQRIYDSNKDDNAKGFKRLQQDPAAASYYGTVCSASLEYCLNLKQGHVTNDFRKISGMEKVKNQTPYDAKLGDFLFKDGHGRMIAGIKRYKNGEIHSFQLFDATSREPRTVTFRYKTPAELLSDLEGEYGLYRYKYIDQVIYTDEVEKWGVMAGEENYPGSEKGIRNRSLTGELGDEFNVLDNEDIKFHILHNLTGDTGKYYLKIRKLKEDNITAGVTTLININLTGLNETSFPMYEPKENGNADTGKYLGFTIQTVRNGLVHGSNPFIIKKGLPCGKYKLTLLEKNEEGEYENLGEVKFIVVGTATNANSEGIVTENQVKFSIKKDETGLVEAKPLYFGWLTNQLNVQYTEAVNDKDLSAPSDDDSEKYSCVVTKTFSVLPFKNGFPIDSVWMAMETEFGIIISERIIFNYPNGEKEDNQLEFKYPEIFTVKNGIRYQALGESTKRIGSGKLHPEFEDIVYEITPILSESSNRILKFKITANTAKDTTYNSIKEALEGRTAFIHRYRNFSLDYTGDEKIDYGNFGPDETNKFIEDDITGASKIIFTLSPGEDGWNGEKAAEVLQSLKEYLAQTYIYFVSKLDIKELEVTSSIIKNDIAPIEVTYELGTINEEAGELTDSQNVVRSKEFIALAEKTYAVSFPSYIKVQRILYKDDYTFDTSEGWRYKSFWVENGRAPFFKLKVMYIDGRPIENIEELAKLVTIYYPNNINKDYKGNIVKLGYNSFYECVKKGYYSFTKDNVVTKSINDAPDDLINGGILEVFPKGADNHVFQFIYNVDGDTWFRWGKNAFKKVGDNGSGVRWLALGDSITQGYYSKYNEDETGVVLDLNSNYSWAKLASQYNGWSFINKAMGGSGFVAKSTHIPSGFDSKLTGREMVEALVEAEDKPLSKIDLVTFMYGVNDWKYGKSLGTFQDNLEVGNTFYSNMRWCIEKILDTNPNIKIVVISPINIWGQDGQTYGNYAGNWGISHLVSEDDNPEKKATLEDFFKAEQEICEYYGIEFIDALHTSVVNRKNIKSVLLDGVHPTLDCHKKLAIELSRKIMSN